MLCKPSPHGATARAGMARGAGVVQDGRFGGAASIWGEQERHFKPCMGNFAARPHICKVFSGRAASAWGQEGVMWSMLRRSHPRHSTRSCCWPQSHHAAWLQDPAPLAAPF